LRFFYKGAKKRTGGAKLQRRGERKGGGNANRIRGGLVFFVYSELQQALDGGVAGRGVLVEKILYAGAGSAKPGGGLVKREIPAAGQRRGGLQKNWKKLRELNQYVKGILDLN